MTPACLLICNDVEPHALDTFQRWYQEEHLPERLGVPGFLTARRYAALEASHPWSALYELTSVDVLTSPEYRTRLEQPSERTRAIMPEFRRTVRCGLDLAQDVGTGVGGVLDMLVLEEGKPLSDAQVSWWTEQPFFERLRLYRAPVSSGTTAAGTSEGQLRAGPDVAWTSVLLIEWSSITGEGLPSIREQVAHQGLQLMPGQGGRFRLMNWRS
jgi:hypothetical protein